MCGQHYKRRKKHKLITNWGKLNWKKKRTELQITRNIVCARPSKMYRSWNVCCFWLVDQCPAAGEIMTRTDSDLVHEKIWTDASDTTFSLGGAAVTHNYNHATWIWNSARRWFDRCHHSWLVSRRFDSRHRSAIKRHYQQPLVWLASWSTADNRPPRQFDIISNAQRGVTADMTASQTSIYSFLWRYIKRRRAVSSVTGNQFPCDYVTNAGAEVGYIRNTVSQLVLR